VHQPAVALADAPDAGFSSIAAAGGTRNLPITPFQDLFSSDCLSPLTECVCESYRGKVISFASDFFFNATRERVAI
jgi:hypothetical protein